MTTSASSPLPTVSERLIAFARRMQADGVPHDAMHEAQRLLINQLKASVGATDHVACATLRDYAVKNGRNSGSDGETSLLWYGDKTSAEHAAIVNGALFEVLDFNDTYIPCFMHATSGVLPAALAAAQMHDCSGHELVEALAIGIEIELACATILMPTGYYRGFVPGGLVGGIGAATACALIGKLDDRQMRNALGLAMCSAFGTYESVGSSALATIMGLTSRAGLVACQLATLGIDAPATAFEGEKGMLASYSDEPATKIEEVIGTLGTHHWRIHGQSYKTVPTETITHAPLDCLFALMARSNGRTVQRMAFDVEPIVVKIADERRARFGALSSELQARFDTRFCAAAAWTRGRFTLAEMKEAAYTDPVILDLRSRIDLIADPSFKTFDGAALTIEYTDGSSDSIRVDDFLGSPGQRLSDEQLSAIFRTAADGLLPADRITAILDAAWALDGPAPVRDLIALLTLH